MAGSAATIQKLSTIHCQTRCCGLLAPNSDTSGQNVAVTASSHHLSAVVTPGNAASCVRTINPAAIAPSETSVQTSGATSVVPRARRNPRTTTITDSAMATAVNETLTSATVSPAERGVMANGIRLTRFMTIIRKQRNQGNQPAVPQQPNRGRLLPQAEYPL